MYGFNAFHFYLNQEGHYMWTFTWSWVYTIFINYLIIWDRHLHGMSFIWVSVRSVNKQPKLIVNTIKVLRVLFSFDFKHNFKWVLICAAYPSIYFYQGRGGRMKPLNSKWILNFHRHFPLANDHDCWFHQLGYATSLYLLNRTWCLVMSAKVPSNVII